MIHCVPRGICSWSFNLSGDGHTGSTEINWVGEQGSLTADGRLYQVVKRGWLSGEWALIKGSSVIARAQKTSPFSRTFQLTGPRSQAVLRAPSAFGRSMQLIGSDANCAISPVHPFTRRAAIEGSIRDFSTVAFAFWLTTLTWRRRARNNSSSGAGGT